MNKDTTIIDLTPNRSLLDPTFGGYKLSLDSIPIYQKPLEAGVDVVRPNDDQFSFNHVKIFYLHNYLHVNPHRLNSVYFVDKSWNIFKVYLSPFNQLKSLIKVFEIPRRSFRVKGYYNVSIKFATANLAVISDGSGSLLFVRVNNEDEDEVWEVMDTGTLVSEGCVLADTRLESVDGEENLHVLGLRVQEKEIKDDGIKSGLFHTLIDWVVYKKTDNTWKNKVTRRITINGSVDYVALEPGFGGVYVVSDKLPKWSYDSEKPVENDLPHCDAPPDKIVYTWMQTDEDITIWLPFSEGTKKSDLTIVIENVRMEIRCKTDIIISSGLHHRVCKELATWTFEKNCLEIHLTKEENGYMWKTLLPDDNRGEEIIEPDVVKKVHRKLGHLCSEKEECGVRMSFNPQQLEDCDSADTDAFLVRMDVNTHTITHGVNLSSCSWLLKVDIDPNETPAMCFRQDVDACVWQLKKPNKCSKSWPYEHIGTFSAFGYVQASKTEKKFLASPPDLSYVVVCEASHRIYVYRQPSPINTELKNRITGRKVETVSKQQLVNLQNTEPILGVYANNKVLYVLLETVICVLVINV